MLDLDYTRRHLIFNGHSDSEYDLRMSGNTPIMVPQIKKSSVEVPYADGTVDTSYFKADKFLLEDDRLEYNFMCALSCYNGNLLYSTEQMNALVTEKIRLVENWAYSGPGTLIDYGIGLYNDDTVNAGNPAITPTIFTGAECVSLSADKAVSPVYWIIKFSMAFTIPPKNLGERINARSSIILDRKDQTRFIIFNKRTSYGLGLTMHGVSPVNDKVPKQSTMDWPAANGSLNLSHVRLNHKTDGYKSMFYKDRTITYRFTKFIDKANGSGKIRSACQMNALIQDAVEEIFEWLYYYTPSLQTIDGNMVAGGYETNLVDSGWITSLQTYGSVPCKFLPAARCTSFSASKTEHADKWGLSINVTFTAYSFYKSGYVYMGTPAEPTPSPTPYCDIWPEYYKIDTTDDPTATEANPTKLYMFQYNSSYSSIDAGIYLAELQRTKDIEFTIDSYNAADTLICNTEFTLDVEDFTSPSIAAQTKTKEWYNFVVGLPPYILITINGVTKAYAPVITIVSSYTSLPTGVAKWCPGTTKYYCLFESSGTAHDLRTYLFVKGTKVKFKVVLRPLSINGLNGAFAGADIYQYYHDNDLSITMPLLFDYLSVIPSTDILSEYGVYGEDEKNTPLSASEIFAMIPTNLNENTRVAEYPQGFTFVNDYENRNLMKSPFSLSYDSESLINSNCVIVKFPRGHRETENNTTTFVEERTGYNNTYILCDGTKPPEGGNIQWLQ